MSKLQEKHFFTGVVTVSVNVWWRQNLTLCPLKNIAQLILSRSEFSVTMIVDCFILWILPKSTHIHTETLYKLDPIFMYTWTFQFTHQYTHVESYLFSYYLLHTHENVRPNNVNVFRTLSCFNWVEMGIFDVFQCSFLPHENAICWHQVSNRKSQPVFKNPGSGL